MHAFLALSWLFLDYEMLHCRANRLAMQSMNKSMLRFMLGFPFTHQTLHTC
jgi:hypothetical protein